jgi:hypothetical protein
VFRRFLVASMAMAVFVLGDAASALAAPPPHDRFPTPIVVNAVPFTNITNTAQATRAGDDPNCVNDSNTVWYRFTPTRSDLYAITARTDGSFSPSLILATGNRGSVSVIDCTAGFGDPFAALGARLTAGVTYRIMLGTYDGIGNPHGGRVTFRVTVPVDPTVGVALTGATVDRVSGIVTVTGTVTCGGGAETAFVNAIVRQVRNGFLARGGNGIEVIPCRRQTRTWRFSLESENNRAFVPGQASVTLDASACSRFDCASVQKMVRVNLVGT